MCFFLSAVTENWCLCPIFFIYLWCLQKCTLFYLIIFLIYGVSDCCSVNFHNKWDLSNFLYFNCCKSKAKLNLLPVCFTACLFNLAI